MALIKCCECGREISDKAAACIHCGCPISAAAAPAGKGPRVLSLNFNAMLSGAQNGKTPQTVYVSELGRNVEFPIGNDTKVGETFKIRLKEGSRYDYLLFRVATVTKAQQAFSGTAPASADARPNAAKTDVNDFLNQYFGNETQNMPTVTIEAKLVGPVTANTTVSVYVPEFQRTVKVLIPNSMEAGKTVTVTAALNAAVNGINRPLKVYIAKVVRMDSPKAAPQPVTRNTPPSTFSKAEMARKIRTLKRRIYTKPLIRLVLSFSCILSAALIFVMMYLFPDGGAPDLLMNMIGIGFFLGFASVFYFTFLPYIIGWYPDPGFFKTCRILKHLERRNLLEKAVTEMEVCETVPFGDRMCLSDHFLFPKKKNGVIIPCDELLWVYGLYARRRGCGHLMLGTEKWGITCFSRIRGRKQYEREAPIAIRELQKRNPSVLVGETRENRKQYFQYINMK